MFFQIDGGKSIINLNQIVLIECLDNSWVLTFSTGQDCEIYGQDLIRVRKFFQLIQRNCSKTITVF